MKVIASLLALSSLAACADDEWSLEVAELWGGGAQPPVEYPGSIAAGEPFEVRVITQGGGCTRFGETRVEASTGGPLITPRNRLATGEGACTADLRPIYHAATLRFDVAGPAIFTVHALRLGSGEPVYLTFDVEVTAP